MESESTLNDMFFYAETLHEQKKLADSIKCYENICRSVSERLRRGDSSRVPARIIPDSLSRIAQIYREQSNLDRSVAFLELSNLFAKQVLSPERQETTFLTLLDRLDAEFLVDGSQSERQTRLLIEALDRVARQSAKHQLEEVSTRIHTEKAKATKSRMTRWARWCERHPASLAVTGLAILLIVAAVLLARAYGVQRLRTAETAARQAQREKAHSEWRRRRIHPQKPDSTNQKPQQAPHRQDL
jgi:cell division protein FtsL